MTVKEIQKTFFVTTDGKEYLSKEIAEKAQLKIRLVQLIADRAGPDRHGHETFEFEDAADLIMKHWGEFVVIMNERLT